MQPSVIRRLPALILALVLALPGLAWGEAVQPPGSARQQQQEASTYVEVIRGVSKTRVDTQFPGSTPTAGGGIRTAQVAGKPKAGPAPGRK